MGTASRVRWCVLLAGVLVFANAHGTVARQRPTCVTIRADETVASVARRLTGDARNMQAPWFQVVNPTTSRRVAKAQDRLHLRRLERVRRRSAALGRRNPGD